MSDDKPVFVQIVELLGVAEAVANDEPVVVITIRPDPPNFFPHNLALTMAQAWRLMIDLQNVMIPFVLLVSFLLATTAGCGARVDLESANWDSSSGETARAAVEVDLLRTQRPETVAQATAPPPKPAVSEEKLVIGSGNTTIILNYRGGDTHIQYETHIHVHESPVPKAEERTAAQQEVQIEPPRRVDARCEQMAKKHEERVRAWREFPFGR